MARFRSVVDCETGEARQEPYTPEEETTADAGATAAAEVPVTTRNQQTLQQQALSALVNNRAYVASTPTAAQTTAQVKALSRQVNGLIRLLLNQLDATD